MLIRTIYIPSRGRADKLITPYTLPPKLRKLVAVVVRKDEFVEYKDRHPKLHFAILPSGINGLSATRQWILDNSDGRYHCQLDDDITGINYKPDCTKFGGLQRAPNFEFTEIISLMERWLKNGFAHVSFTDRMSAARPSKLPYYDNGRIAQTLFYDKNAIVDIGARFDRVKLMQDLDMNLQLLGAGYVNRVSTMWSYNIRSEDAAGGCKLYRTDELKKKVGLKMMKLHPGITRLDTKHKYGRTYYFMRTDWKNALKPQEG